MEIYDLHLQRFGGNRKYEFYSEFAPTYLYLRSLTANLKVAMRKRFFVSAPQINLPGWFFLFFHTNSIWTQYIKLFWKIWITKNVVTTFYITLSFHPYIFRTKSLQGNRKKPNTHFLVFLRVISFFSWEKQERRRLVNSKCYKYQKSRFFFTLKYPRIDEILSKSDFVIYNLNLSQSRSIA